MGLRVVWGLWTVAVLLVAGQAGWAAPAGLVVEPTRVSVGKVQAGQRSTLRFRLRNRGARTLKIRSVLGDCGCLTPEYPRSLAAGAAAELRARFEILPLWSGPVRRGLTVVTDDPVQPRIRLTVLADVVPYLTVEPRGQVVMPVQPGGVYQREITLTPRPGSGIRLTKAASDSPLVKASLVAPARGNRSGVYRLKLKVGPYDKPGDYGATVHVTTTQRHLEDWPIQVRGQATSGPVVIPQRVLLPIVRADEAQAGLTQLRVFTRKGRLRVLSVETGTPRLQAEVVPTASGRSHRVLVRPAGRLAAGTLTTTLQIRTDDPRYPVVEVPFQATVH